MLTVRVGSSNATAGGDVLRVVEIIFHPNYKPSTLEFNFAVVKLHKNITFGKGDLRVDMVPYSKDKIIPVDNTVTFLGWGSVLVRNSSIMIFNKTAAKKGRLSNWLARKTDYVFLLVSALTNGHWPEHGNLDYVVSRFH